MENKKAEDVRTFYSGIIEDDLDGYQYLCTSPFYTSENNTFPDFCRDSVSPSLWDNDELVDSQRSSPVLLEDPWTFPHSPMLSSASNSPLQYCPSPEGLYASYFVKQEDSIEAGNNRARKALGPRPSKVTSDLALASRRAADTRPLEYDNTARDHPLYHNVLPKADGLYHCPFEDDPNANCTHKPEKLKCNYDKFVDSHLKPYTCKVNTCKDLCFSSTACLLRHERDAHGDKPFLCTYEGCERGVPGNGFPRHWNLRDHMKRVHNDPGVGRDSSPNYQPSPTNKGKKRKAGNSPLSWENTSEKSPASPWMQEQESSLIDRYREKQQKLLEIVRKLHDPMSADNMTLLRNANDCVKVMVQTTQRINSGAAMEKMADMDIG